MRFKSMLIGLGALTATAATTHDTVASSHREAPFLTKSPKVDATDFYMFNSFEAGRDEFVTLIANYVPLQDPYGGPNYFTMDPEALYEIHVDNNGDAQEDITFQFRFNNALANGGNGIALDVGAGGDAGTTSVGIPLAIAGGVNGAGGAATNINVNESYTVKVVRGNRRTGTAGDVVTDTGANATFTKPLDNVGAKTFAGGYAAYANQFRYDVNIPGCSDPTGKSSKLFVGQRKEGFAVNLGTIFDLVNAPLGVIADAANRDALTANAANIHNSKNITTLALEVPKSCLTSGSSTILGGWTTASVRQARVINPKATYGQPSKEGGAWAQVSRLGSPLVNEVVIGIKDKDRFNSSEPKDDGQFAAYVTNPTLPELIQIIFGPGNAPAPNLFPRADLVAAFLTGVEAQNGDAGLLNVNKNGSTAEYLRLNTALGATAAASQNNLGALECFTAAGTTATPILDVGRAGCDPAGFPNGRRPGDDVVDIALRVVMGRLLPSTVAGAGAVPLHDAVLQSQSQFDATFPYLKTPLGGT